MLYQVHGPDVLPGRLHRVVPCRPGHSLPLQDAAGGQDVAEGGAGDAHLHQRRPGRLARCGVSQY